MITGVAHHPPAPEDLQHFVIIAGDHIRFTETGHQDVLLARAAEIVNDTDGVIPCLLPVGIGNARPFVEQKATGPGMTFIL